MSEARILDISGLAEYMEWTIKSTRTAHARSTKRRREGLPRPGDLPKPDEQFGGSPVWYLSTIQEWKPERPGRGKGGGRPKKPRPVEDDRENGEARS